MSYNTLNVVENSTDVPIALPATELIAGNWLEVASIIVHDPFTVNIERLQLKIENCPENSVNLGTVTLGVYLAHDATVAPSTETALETVLSVNAPFNCNENIMERTSDPLQLLNPGLYSIVVQYTGTESVVASVEGNYRINAIFPYTDEIDLSVINGLRWELPNLVDSPYIYGEASCAPTSVASQICGGPEGTLFNVTFRVRGVVELVDYRGGSDYGPFNIGGLYGDQVGDRSNIYNLEISDPPQKFNMNNRQLDATGALEFPFRVVDYTLVIPIRAGARMTLVADSRDGFQLSNRLYRLVCPGIFPDPYFFDGQFLQMDVQDIEVLYDDED